MKTEDLRKGTLYFNKDHGCFIILSLSDSYYSGVLFTTAELFFPSPSPYRMICYYRKKDNLVGVEKIADLDE